MCALLTKTCYKYPDLVRKEKTEKKKNIIFERTDEFYSSSVTNLESFIDF